MATEQQIRDASADGAAATGAETLTVTDNRTGATYELPIVDGTVRAMELRQIKVEPDEFGMMAYDPAFTNTAACRSAITYIDGEAGILEHRGYSIEQLCERSTFLEVAYLLIFGELPTGPSSTAGSTTSPTTPSSTRTSSSSSRASATTRIRWGCCSPASARSPPSIPTPSTPKTRKSATWRRCG